MRFRLGFGLGFGLGYYLGAMGGRERFEQINRMARRVRGSETFEAATDRAKEVVDVGVERAKDAVDSKIRDRGENGDADREVDPFLRSTPEL